VTTELNFTKIFPPFHLKISIVDLTPPAFTLVIVDCILHSDGGHTTPLIGTACPWAALNEHARSRLNWLFPWLCERNIFRRVWHIHL